MLKVLREFKCQHISLKQQVTFPTQITIGHDGFGDHGDGFLRDDFSYDFLSEF